MDAERIERAERTAATLDVHRPDHAAALDRLRADLGLEPPADQQQDAERWDGMA